MTVTAPQASWLQAGASALSLLGRESTVPRPAVATASVPVVVRRSVSAPERARVLAWGQELVPLPAAPQLSPVHLQASQHPWTCYARTWIELLGSRDDDWAVALNSLAVGSALKLASSWKRLRDTRRIDGAKQRRAMPHRSRQARMI
ncbi:MAG: hypothetical protein ACKVP7_13290 [Hyphomicrobiaceae bacterium]